MADNLQDGRHYPMEILHFAIESHNVLAVSLILTVYSLRMLLLKELIRDLKE